MARKYARGEKAWGICGRGGHRMLLKDMVYDGRFTNMRVDPAWYEAKHPQEIPVRVDDPVALYRPSPEDSGAGYELDLWELNLDTGVLADAGEVLFGADDGSGLTFNIGSQVTFIASACNQALGNAGTINVSVGAGPVADDLVVLVLHSTTNITLQTEVAGFTRVMNKLANINTTRGFQEDLPVYICFKKLTGVETNWTHTISGGAAGERFQLCAYVLRGQDLTRPIGSYTTTSQIQPFRSSSETSNNLHEPFSVIGGGHFALNDGSNGILAGGSFGGNDSSNNFTGWPANVMVSGQVANHRVDDIIYPSAASKHKLTWLAMVTGLSTLGRTNYLGRSESAFSNAFFTKSGVTSTVDNNGAQSAYANIYETLVDYTTANTLHYHEFTLSSLTIGQVYTFGVRSSLGGTGGATPGIALTVNDGSERGYHFGGGGTGGRVSTQIGTGTEAYCTTYNTAWPSEANDCMISFTAAATTAVFRLYRTSALTLSTALPAGTQLQIYCMMVALGRTSISGGYLATTGGVAVTAGSTGYVAPIIRHTDVSTSTLIPGITVNTRAWALEIRAAGTAVLPMKIAKTHAWGHGTSQGASGLSITGTAMNAGSKLNNGTAGSAELVGQSRHPWDTNKKLYFEVKMDLAAAGTGFVAGVQESWNPGIFGGASLYTWAPGAIAGFGYRMNGNTYLDGTDQGVTSAAITTGDILGVGVDWTLRQVTFYKNGTLQRTMAMPSGDRSFTPAVYSGDISGLTFRLHTCTMNYSGSFGGRLPSGFKAWDYDNEVA